MSLATIIDDLISKANTAFGVIDGKLRNKADKTEVYDRAYLDNPVNTLGVNVATANKLRTARVITLNGEATGAASFDGSGNITLVVTVPKLTDKADKVDTLTPAEVDSRIQMVIGTAPEALNALGELAEAMGNDPNFAATMTLELAKKANQVDVYSRLAADAKFSTQNEHNTLALELSGALQQLATAFQNGADQISGVVQQENI